jgi:hypothetical protein
MKALVGGATLRKRATGISHHASTADAHLRALATRRGEKCGLAIAR